MRVPTSAMEWASVASIFLPCPVTSPASRVPTIAPVQARDPGPGRVYYQRKLGEGKTPAEARGALKRRLTNVLYRHHPRSTSTG